MRRVLFVGLLCAAQMVISQSSWSADRYNPPANEILKVKNLTDDPSPFYTKSNFYKQWIPDDVWSQITYDPEAMKAAWEKAVGFKAPDVVGKIAPEIKPGRYTLSDKTKFPFDKLMTAYHYKKFNQPGADGLPNHMGYFTELEVVPTQQWYHALPVAEATLKNMGKTQQDENGYIVFGTFEGGFPFPRPSGDHMGIQLLYNWEKRRKDHENARNYDLTVGINSKFRVDHEGVADYYWLRLEGRVMLPPFGWYDERAKTQREMVLTVYTIFSPKDLYGNVYSAIGYADPKKETNFLAYVNLLRRVRKLSSSDRQDQAVGQDISFDDADGFTQQLSPDIYPYDYKVIDDREFLVPAYTTDASEYFDSKDSFKWKGLRFERRPVWVVEMHQRDPNYLYSKRVIYFDKETLMPLLFECYDKKGRYYRTFENLWGEVVPMGIFNSILNVSADWIDVHSTLTFAPSFPATWMSRDEFDLRNMFRSK
ncbi:MAG: DUF1329 domain-containing protein [bacterium]